jgi:hypothetical protein
VKHSEWIRANGPPLVLGCPTTIARCSIADPGAERYDAGIGSVLHGTRADAIWRNPPRQPRG